MLEIQKPYKIKESKIKFYNNVYYIFDCIIDYSGRQIITSGIDKDPQIAYNKMISETCERYCMFHHNIKKSTSMAAHPELNKSLNNSTLESIERNFLISLSKDFKLSHDSIKTKKNITLYDYNLKNGYYFCLSKIKQSKCFSQGVSVSNDIHEAREKSILEAIMINESFSQFSIKGTSFKIYDDFININNISLLDEVIFINHHRFVTGVKIDK